MTPRLENPSRYVHPFTDEDDAAIIRMAGEGRSGSEIGEALGRTRNSIIGRCNRRGIQLRGNVTRYMGQPSTPRPAPPVARATRLPRNCDFRPKIFTPAEVSLIAAMAAAGKTLTQTAEVLGVSRGRIAKHEKKTGVKFHRGVIAGQHKPRASRPRDNPIIPWHRKSYAPIMQPIDPESIKPYMLTIMQLRGDSCRWPYNDPKHDDFRYCGCPVGQSGPPYCEGHRQMSYQPRKVA